MANPPKAPKCVLVVDDHEDALKLASMLIKDTWPGVKVLTAPDGNEALRLAFESQPDLVLTDVKIPGPNGIELVRMLREAVSSGSCKVVVWTGYHDNETRESVMRLGADAYVAKPVDASTLRRTLLSVL